MWKRTDRETGEETHRDEGLNPPPRGPLDLLRDVRNLPGHIVEALHQRNLEESLFPRGVARAKETSSVLFLLSRRSDREGRSGEPCLVLNKRSERVRQPGDLCFPGGSIASRMDLFLSRLLKLPFSPLTRWPYWDYWWKHRGGEARRLALLLASGLREGLEEMGLNPLGVRFLGPMAPHDLEIFSRVLYPMVGWIRLKNRYWTNWEVEKVLTISIRDLLNQRRYACYRIRFGANPAEGAGEHTEDFPCYRDEKEGLILWGVTYEMVMSFLDLLFGFKVPDPASLPVIHGSLDGRYLQGARIEADTPIPGSRQKAEDREF